MMPPLQNVCMLLQHARDSPALGKAELCSTETPSQPSLTTLGPHSLHLILANFKNDTESKIIMKSDNLSWQLL